VGCSSISGSYPGPERLEGKNVEGNDMERLQCGAIKVELPSCQEDGIKNS
jgi:hypothetical protein